MLSFGAPLGLLALLAVLPVLAAYFLRRAQPVRVVSALFLWRTPDERSDAGPRFERWSRERALILELLAIVAAAAFLSEVGCGAAEPPRHLVVVLDGSFSMQPSTKRAKQALAALISESKASVVTVIESGVRPKVLLGPRLEAAQVLPALSTWAPSQPTHDLGASVERAKQLAEPDARLELVTDGPVTSPLPAQTHVVSVGQREVNVALTSARRHDERGRAMVSVRVSNFGDRAVRVPVVFSAGPLTREVELDPGASSTLRVALLTAGPVRVSLPHDALEFDNEVSLLPVPTNEVKLEVLPGLDDAAAAAVARFGEMLDQAAKNTLTVGPAGSTAAVTLGVADESLEKSFIGPFFTQRDHPALDDVRLSGVVWTAGPNPQGRVLISAGEAVLMSEGDDGSIHLNLDLARSNVQKTEAWPVLLNNLVRLQRARAVGLPRKQLMLGEEVAVVTSVGATWALRHDDGTTVPILGSGPVTLSPLAKPGRWSLLENGEAVDALEVLPLDPLESDLRTLGPFELQPTAKLPMLAALGETDSRAWWPLTALLALVVADFMLTASERRAR
jgi:hypothetical protein